MAKKTIKDINVKGKKVLIRVDFNVPLKNGEISDENRIVEALPTIKYVLSQGGRAIVFSHLGRVKDEADKAKNSLEIVAKRLSEHLNQKVVFVPVTRGKALEDAINALKNGEVLMFENTRFEDIDGNKESKNNPELGQYWASLGDVFVNDAFGTAHRAAASNVGIAANIKETVAGFLLEKEINFIGGTLENPQRPFVAILGGAKVSDKIEVIKNLLKIADTVLIGGGMAFTFFKAQGLEIGKSLLEADKVDLAKELLELAKGKIILGDDVITGKAFDPETEKNVRSIYAIPSDELGLDIGPRTIAEFESYIAKAKTVVWNGPLGVFEFAKFAEGTRSIAQAIVEVKNQATTIIGGGDSAAAVIQFGLAEGFTHISTGGGASLEYLEGKVLPGIECVDNK
ncbi:MAG: phosphoglycerate kinase [Tenericutes bacterium GWC2_39_45]|nr:MAG: phosphoglycerate kinase [Tenericutes bacterium GWA2_38_26]OHE31172.1 MAG: phosphoglycerate kinase [Tenericutes bacterium GWC2_39_45]OHE31696.1 MAG: phosphoglycerate kinase [Tenericutes bacterium GWD2_38_27]OHE37521.1 MAG: phosphoglycerate kinase [Tenericutes bacterium GWE2_38_8]OHE41791.1 MAG: phosphoglycerate kinase [Tenericutes bacterium GWF2_38_8]HCB67066.1 phosphoglycerate kinase [Acholeplasmataceae bacterium]